MHSSAPHGGYHDVTNQSLTCDYLTDLRVATVAAHDTPRCRYNMRFVRFVYDPGYVTANFVIVPVTLSSSQQPGVAVSLKILVTPGIASAY
jgi:hypothetical protein